MVLAKSLLQMKARVSDGTRDKAMVLGAQTPDRAVFRCAVGGEESERLVMELVILALQWAVLILSAVAILMIGNSER